MPTTKETTNLIINKVESLKVYEYLKNNGIMNEDEVYIVEPVVDSALSTTSINPVQNKVIKAALDNKADKNILNTLTKSQVITALGYTPPTQDTVYTHPNSGVTAGTYNSVTVNEQGHITAGSNVSYSTGVTIDSALSTTSINPVQNKVIKAALDNKADKNILNTLTKSQVTTALGYTPPTQDTVYTHPTYTAKTGKPTTNATPGFGSTFTVSQITSDTSGHVTGATDRTITIPNATATQSAAGLMSAADKKKLDDVATGANAYSHPTSGVTAGTYNKITVDKNGHVTSGSNESYVNDSSTTDTSKGWSANKINTEISQLNTNINNKTSLTLGTSSTTAYRGDYGNTAYNHSKVTSGNPHNVTKSDVGLGNVENKTIAQILAELTSSHVTTALGYTPLQQSSLQSALSSLGYGKVLGGSYSGNGEGIAVRFEGSGDVTLHMDGSKTGSMINGNTPRWYTSPRVITFPFTPLAIVIINDTSEIKCIKQGGSGVTAIDPSKNGTGEAEYYKLSGDKLYLADAGVAETWVNNNNVNKYKTVWTNSLNKSGVTYEYLIF